MYLSFRRNIQRILQDKHGSWLDFKGLRELNDGAESPCAYVSGSIVLQALLGIGLDMPGHEAWANSDVDLYVSDVRLFGVSVLWDVLYIELSCLW